MQLKALTHYPKSLLFLPPNQCKTVQKKFVVSKKDHENASDKFFMQMVAEKSFGCQFSDMLFHRFISGRIVFLYGTSTAGKSSIVTYLNAKAKSKGHDLVITGTDVVWGLHIFDLFVQYSCAKASFIRSYFTIDEIFDCIWNPLLVFKLIDEKSISVECGERIRIILDEFRTKQKDLLKDFSPSKRPFFCSYSFLPELCSGATVIVDTAADKGDIDEFFRALITELVHCRIDIVLVYCSLKKLIGRLYSRNEEALKSSSINKGRPGAFPLEQYTVIYEKTDLHTQAIDAISFSDTQIPTDLPKICKSLSDQLSEQLDTPIFTYNEKEWTETQVLVQKRFGLKTHNNTVHIKPKCDYQLMVNAGEESAKACAKKILKTLRI